MPTAEQKNAALERNSRDWADKQRKITDATTALTAAGALTLGASLAAKRKIAGRILPPKWHERMRSSDADDIRNTIALAGMTGGVVSGVHWSKKLREDAMTEHQRQQAALKNAGNYARATKDDLAKGIVASGISFTRKGLRPRRAFYRRPSRRLV